MRELIHRYHVLHSDTHCLRSAELLFAVLVPSVNVMVKDKVIVKVKVKVKDKVTVKVKAGSRSKSRSRSRSSARELAMGGYMCLATNTTMTTNRRK